MPERRRKVNAFLRQGERFASSQGRTDGRRIPVVVLEPAA
jgi:hypothetical protein